MYYEMLVYPIEGLTTGKNNVASLLIDTKIQKYFSFQNLEQNEEAYQIIQELQDNFEKGVFSKTIHASLLTRIYRDLVRFEPANKNKYFNKIEALLKHCEDKAIIEFQFLLTKFERSQDINEMQEIINKSRECFQKNKAEFKNEEAAPFYNLEMELKLAELQLVRLQIQEHDKKIKQLNKTNLKRAQSLLKEKQDLLKAKEHNLLQETDTLLPKIRNQKIDLKRRFVEAKLRIARYNGN